MNANPHREVMNRATDRLVNNISGHRKCSCVFEKVVTDILCKVLLSVLPNKLNLKDNFSVSL
jgi:hypothetical protein